SSPGRRFSTSRRAGAGSCPPTASPPGSGIGRRSWLAGWVRADEPLVLERVLARGVAHPITQPVAHFVPQAASLSPDRRWVGAEGDTGCASRYVYVAPARGGTARLVYGRSPTNPFDANFSELLGWSADGRMVVVFTPPYCDEPLGPQHPPSGVYLVDPRTLA